LACKQLPAVVPLTIFLRARNGDGSLSVHLSQTERPIYALERWLEKDDKPTCLGIFDELECALHALNFVSKFQADDLQVDDYLAVSRLSKNTLQKSQIQLVRWTCTAEPKNGCYFGKITLQHVCALLWWTRSSGFPQNTDFQVIWCSYPVKDQCTHTITACQSVACPNSLDGEEFGVLGCTWRGNRVTGHKCPLGHRGFAQLSNLYRTLRMEADGLKERNLEAQKLMEEKDDLKLANDQMKARIQRLEAELGMVVK
jgi:hypothetical protein